ncbi:MAG: hypothetical protein A4S08_05665 [Proteobacteria bacterium SG_bin4]|nr:MAG: hypothetical protein A4S08_05665 [Proteobacteria bacterium SG_bin4]
MTDEQKSQKWWQTVPGLLSATAGLITAATGMIVALHQTGFLDKDSGHAPQAPSGSLAQPETVQSDAAPNARPNTASSSKSEVAQTSIALAAGSEVRLGNAVYKILAVQLDRYNVEKLSLRFTVRMTNNDRYPVNFWDESFRLLVDGAPLAPVSGLNKLLHSRSAEEGEIEFVIPVTAQSVALKIEHLNESTEIPINLPPQLPLAKP